jgi:hypothetical protein
VAQTIVGLGLDLGSVKTTRTLRDALKWCIRASADPASDPEACSPSSHAAHGGPRS